MQTDRRQISDVSEQSVQKLADTRFVIAAVESCFPDQLLDVVGPPLGEAVADGTSTRGGRQAWREFHDRFLSYGGPPIPLVRRAMLGAQAGPVL